MAMQVGGKIKTVHKNNRNIFFLLFFIQNDEKGFVFDISFKRKNMSNKCS